MSARLPSLLLGLALLAGCGEEAPAEPVPIEDVRTAEAPPPTPAPVDMEGPTWPEDAALHAEATGRLDATERTVTLTWPAATDDVGVVAYSLRIDGVESARVDAPAEEGRLEAVAFEQARTFAVVAVDDAGNESSAIETRDALSPWLPEGETLGATIAGAQATLTWPAAQDDGEVTGYLVMRGEAEVATLRPDQRRYRFRPEEGATPILWAEDAAGHKARIGDASQVSARLAQARVEQMLLGALGSGNGAFADVFAGSATTGSTADIMAQAEGVGVARGGSLRERGGGVAADGTSRGLGALSGPGGGRVGSPTGGIGELQPAGGGSAAPPAQVIRGRVSIGALEDESGSGVFDPAIVTRMLRLRLSAIRACYERELRSAPTIAGRVVLEMTIEPSGLVSRTAAPENTTGSEAVAACVTGTARRFRFNPGPEGGSVTYRYPVVFAPES